jgi:hypothetical protein
MELDELKSAWQTLDQRLQRDQAISLALYSHQKLDSTRSSLRPLYAGQWVQLFGGIFVILLAGFLWSTKPTAASVIIAGVIVHAYGIGCVIVAAMVMAAIRRIDYSGAVADIQNRLARVRRAYIVSAIVAGLSWWLLWIPFLMLLAGLGGIDLYSNAPSLVWIGTALGIAGLLGTRWLYRYSQSKPHSRLGHAVDDALTGRSLQRARACLDEIRRFNTEA